MGRAACRVLSLVIATSLVLGAGVAALPRRAPAAAPTMEWTRQTPPEFEYTVYDVSAADATHAWAVGASGSIWFFDGASWSAQGYFFNTLAGVFALDETHVWAVGTAGQNHFYNGASWELRQEAGSPTFRDVVFQDHSSGWAVGDVGGDGALYYTDDGGATWSNYAAVGDATDYRCVDIDLTDPDNPIVWAGGAGGVVVYQNYSLGAGPTDSWNTPGPSITGNVNGIDMTGALTGWAVDSDGKAYTTSDGGDSWTTGGLDTGPALNDIRQLAPTSVWAVGGSGQIWYFNGSLWAPQTSGITSELWGLDMLDATHGWAVGGFLPAAIRYFNGSSWAGQYCPATYNLSGLSALDTSHLYACADNAGKVFTGDGSSLDLMDPGPPNGNLRDIDALNASYVWTVGDVTGPDPSLWLYHGSPPAWEKMVGVPYGSPPYQNIEAIDAMSESDAWAVGVNDTCIHWAGVSWITFDPPGAGNLWGVHARAAGDVWVVGDSGRVIHFDGTAWSDESPAILDTMYGVHAISTTSVWIAGADGRVMEYDGSTWHDRSPAAFNGDIYSISGITRNNIWACGQDGLWFFDGSLWTEQDPGTNEALRDVVALSAADVYVAGNLCTVYRGRATPTISSVSPATGENDGQVSISNLAGTCFAPGATVKLKKTGQSDIHATNVNVVSDTKITCDFNLTGKAAGNWNLVVANSNGKSATKSNAFIISESPEVNATWYLAEGTTAWGFVTYVTVENPGNQALTAKVTFMRPGGDNSEITVPLPAESQTTIDPVETIGECDFSTKVECLEGEPIAVDRTMMWVGEGATTPEAHSSVGVNAPATTWYLPEGSSAWGFECWLLIQNPGSTAANCQVTYMTADGSTVVEDKVVPANSRATYNMADDIGEKDASIKVTSDVPVIPERAMYRYNRREGHDSIGTTAAATDYYLAEGTTAWGFTTYVLVQNPNAQAADIDVTYMTNSGPVPYGRFSMPGNSRQTIRVNDFLPDADFSTQVHGSRPIIAERAMYWDSGVGEACHDSIGLAGSHRTFYFPDGESDAGDVTVETFTLVQNPSEDPVQVSLTYFSETGGATSHDFTIGANTRATYNMKDLYGDGRAAVMVECLTVGQTVMVERAMYIHDRAGGTDTIGAYSD
ncbi:MAG: hypothetical protein KKF41_11425 [Actinobacteria bacterium]|nr:hypothetical protein [Actinomycetota bacterium]MBU1944051.1 hypothetical protein [Actinomycetota bacterium]MBU2688185.1 hypothetical protein [Actinomycetota bacterium]